MSDKILKDITTYDGTETFKNFRETLVSEVQENFDTIEEKLKNGSIGGLNELTLIKSNLTISSGSSNTPLQKWCTLRDYMDSEEIINLLSYNQVFIEITLNDDVSFYIIDLRLFKLKKANSKCNFNLIGRKYDNNSKQSIFKKAILSVDIQTSGLVFYTYFEKEEDVEKCLFNLYASY